MGIYDDNEFFEQAPDEFDREYDSAKTIDDQAFEMMNEKSDTELDFAATSLKKKNAVVHTALAGLGMIPGIGIAFDTLDAALYGMEGDALGAGLSLISAIPVLGLAGGATRMTKGIASKLDTPLSQKLPRWGEVGAGPGHLARKAGEEFPDLAGRLPFNIKETKALEQARRAKLTDKTRSSATELANRAGRGELTDKTRSSATELMNRAGRGVTRVDQEKLAEVLGGAAKNVNQEMSTIKRISQKYGIEHGNTIDISAFLKGNHFIRGKSPQQLGISMEAFTDITKAIARGARLFQSLPVLMQNEILDDMESAPIPPPNTPEEPTQMDFEEEGFNDIAGQY
jgi:hypothetical protein